MNKDKDVLQQAIHNVESIYGLLSGAIAYQTTPPKLVIPLLTTLLGQLKALQEVLPTAKTTLSQKTLKQLAKKKQEELKQTIQEHTLHSFNTGENEPK